jgi:hypothetical protein
MSTQIKPTVLSQIGGKQPTPTAALNAALTGAI